MATEPLEPRRVLNAYSPAMNDGIPVTDWMKSLPDSWTLDQISIPATHDTMCYGDWFYLRDPSAWYLNYIPNGVRAVSETQDLSLRQQLDWGVRGIDIRAGEASSSAGEPDFRIYHGWAQLSPDPIVDAVNPFVFSYIVKTLNDFLTSHPKETVVMRLKPEAFLSDKGDEVQATLEHYVRKYPDLFWTGGPANAKGSVVPTLGEARGKVVILSEYESKTEYKWIRYGGNDLTFSNGDGSTQFGKAIYDDTYNSPYSDWKQAMESRWSKARGSFRTAMLARDSAIRDWYFTNLNTTVDKDNNTQLGLVLPAPFDTWTPRKWAAGTQTSLPLNQRAFQFFSGITAGRVGLVWLDFPEKLDPNRSREGAAGDPGLINAIIGLNWPYVTVSTASIPNPGGTTQVTARGVDPTARVSFLAPKPSVYREMQNAVGSGSGVDSFTIQGSPSFPVQTSNGQGTFTATYTSDLLRSPDSIVPTVVINGKYDWMRSQTVEVANPGIRLSGGGPLSDVPITVRVERAGVSLAAPLAVKLQLGGTGKHSGVNPDYLVGGVGVLVNGAVVTAMIPANEKGVDVVISPNNIGVAAGSLEATYSLTTIGDPAYPIDGDNASVGGVIAARGYMVTNTNDSGDGSLRQALANAAAGGGAAVVTFGDMFTDGTRRTIMLNSPLLLGKVLGSGLAVKGPGARLLTIKGMDSSQPVISNPRSDKLRSISGLTISGGRYGIESQGPLDILQCHVTANAYGGIFVYGTHSDGDPRVQVVESTVSGNLGSGGDDQDGRGGSGILCSRNGKITVVNSTVSGNKGAGIERTTTGGRVTVRNATVILNAHSGLRVSGTLNDNEVYNSIVAGNGSGDADNITGLGGWNNNKNPSQVGNNVIGTGTSGLSAILATTPVVDQGDLTPFFPLVPNSPAIDTGNNSQAVLNDLSAGLLNDQRGPGFPRIQGGTVDIGAIEGASTVAGVRLGGGGEAVHGGTVSFRLHRSGAAAAPLTVTLAASGTAIFGTHYAVSGGSISFTGSTATAVFPAGMNDVELTLTNTTSLKNLTATLRLVAGDGYSVPGDGSVAFAVLNNDGTLVTNTAWAGSGSLLNALFFAQTQPSATVRFAGPAFESGSPATITLNGQLRVTTGDVRIVGPGADLLTIVGPIFFNKSEALFLNEGGTLALENLTLRGGLAGVHNKGGTVRISRCVITGGTNGGLINFDNEKSLPGSLFVDDTTIYDTGSLLDTGLSVGFGGAIQVRNSTLHVSNSTITGNRAPYGAGVHIQNDKKNQSVSFSNCTIAANTAAADGGGIYRSGPEALSVVLYNTIVAGNTGYSSWATDISGRVSGRNNLIGDAFSSGELTDGLDGNIVGVNGSGTRPLASILDATLKSSGGRLPVLEVVSGSPAIDAGRPQSATSAAGAALAFDQRGAAFLRVRNGIVDIGAVESGVAPSVSQARVPSVTADGAVLEATVGSDGGDAITVRGFMVADPQTNPRPTLGSQAQRFDVAGSTGVFSTTAAALSQGLRPRSTYVVVAFASTRWGTSYSEPTTFTTAGNPTATLVTTSARIIDFGDSVFFAARVKNAGIGGTVRFTMDGNDLGAGTYAGVEGDETIWTLQTSPKQMPPPGHEIGAVFMAAVGSGRADSTGILEGNFGVRGNVVPSGKFASLGTTFGIPSAASKVTITPAGTGDVVASAPAGFELSADGGTWAASVTYLATDDIRTHDLFVRLSAAAGAGSYAGNVTLSWKTWDGFDKAVALPIPPSTVVQQIIDISVLSGSQTASTVYTGSTRLVKRGSGTLVLSTANSHSGGLIVEEGEVIVRHVAALGTGILEVKAGAKVTLDVGTGNVSIGLFSHASAGSIDVGYGKFTIAAGGYSLSALVQLLKTGYESGWAADSGVTSRTADSLPGGGLGYVVNQDGSVTVGFAASGDTNLDGTVDILDASAIMASGKFDAESASSWSEGDFNYDNMVDMLDLERFLSAGHGNAGPYIPTAPSSPQPQANAPELSATDAAFLALTDGTANGVPSPTKKLRFRVI